MGALPPHRSFRSGNSVSHSFISYRSSSSMWKCDHLEPAPAYNSVPRLRSGRALVPTGIQDRIFFIIGQREPGEPGSFDS